MKKSAIIKIVSIVLVLCTLITLCIIPASAAEAVNENRDRTTADEDSFLWNFPISRCGAEDLNNVLTMCNIGDIHFSARNDSYKNALMRIRMADPYKLTLYQAVKEYNIDKDDVFTFNLSILSRYSEAMALFIYFKDGTYKCIDFYIDPEKVFTKESMVVKYSGESLAFDSRVYCHRYTLNYSYTATEDNNIIGIQIQQQFASVNQIKDSWIYYEDCTFYIEDNSNLFKSISNSLRNTFNSLKSFFERCGLFFLNFASNIKGAVSPLFDKVGTWISNAATTTWDNFKTTLVNIKDGIINLPSNIKGFFTSLGDRISGFFDGISEGIYNWFSETFLGKVLRISNKTKEFISLAGNDVQYAALDDEVGESTEETAPDDWDLRPSPSFEIDIDYYRNLFTNYFEGGLTDG